LAFPAVLLEINSISDEDALIVAFAAVLDPVKSIIRASEAAIAAFPAELLPLKTNPLLKGRFTVALPAVLMPVKDSCPEPPIVIAAFPAVLVLLKVIVLLELLQSRGRARGRQRGIPRGRAVIEDYACGAARAGIVDDEGSVAGVSNKAAAVDIEEYFVIDIEIISRATTQRHRIDARRRLRERDGSEA
jgi:hypothetical protein